MDSPKIISLVNEIYNFYNIDKQQKSNIEDVWRIDLDHIIIISNVQTTLDDFFWKEMNCFIYVVDSDLIRESFRYFFKIPHNSNIFHFDNLLQLAMIVKNAGDNFKKILEKIIPHIDRWTIIDTGSTDSTIDIIENYLSKKIRGNLYHEPFTNFRDCRNRCLDLCGDFCEYIIMLDDSYYIEGDIRSFLKLQTHESFSITINTTGITTFKEYTSNRIIKSTSRLRYIYPIHEVIQPNKDLLIPKEYGYILDCVDQYMIDRSQKRRPYDIQQLEQLIVDDPTNPRHLYYLAYSYYTIGEFSKAMDCFQRRFFSKSDNDEEKYDSLLNILSLCTEWNLKRSFYEIGVFYYPDRKVYINYIEELFYHGEWKYAIELVKKNIRYIVIPNLEMYLFQCNEYLLGKEITRDIFWKKAFIELDRWKTNRVYNDMIDDIIIWWKIDDYKPISFLIDDSETIPNVRGIIVYISMKNLYLLPMCLLEKRVLSINILFELSENDTIFIPDDEKIKKVLCKSQQDIDLLLKNYSYLKNKIILHDSTL